MSNLLVELLLVFVLSAVIGWFMGRYFCKSGEYEERDLKVKSLKQNKLLDTNLEQMDKDYSQSKVELKEQHNQISTLQQSHSGLESQINTLNKERDEMRVELQQLEQYKSKFESLTDDSMLQKKQLLKVKEKNINHSDQIETLLGVRNTLEKQLDTNKNACQSLEKKLLEAENIQQARLEQIQFHDSKAKEYQSAIEALEAQYRASVQENTEQESHIKTISAEKISIRGELEKSTKENHALEEKCLTLKDESLDFGSKLTRLLEEKAALAKQVEQLNIENNDYLGRLRAVSSVVDVVGTA